MGSVRSFQAPPRSGSGEPGTGRPPWRERADNPRRGFGMPGSPSGGSPRRSRPPHPVGDSRGGPRRSRRPARFPAPGSSPVDPAPARGRSAGSSRCRADPNSLLPAPVSLRLDTDDDRVRNTGLPAPTPAARLGRSLPRLCLHRVHAHRAGPPDEGGPEAGGAGAPELVTPSLAPSRRRARRIGDPIAIHELSGPRCPSPAPGPARFRTAAPGGGTQEPRHPPLPSGGSGDDPPNRRFLPGQGRHRPGPLPAVSFPTEAHRIRPDRGPAAPAGSGWTRGRGGRPATRPDRSVDGEALRSRTGAAAPGSRGSPGGNRAW